MNYKQVLLVCLVLLVIVAVGPARVAAQTQTTGDITGAITDPSGAVIPDAKVTLKSVEKGWTQETKTSTSGVFRFTLSSPGSYLITVSASGFRTATRQVDAALGQVVSADFKLELGPTAQTVNVTEEPPLLQTENGNVATTIVSKQIREVPNPGNDLTYIAQIAPGSVMNTQAGYGNFSSYGLSGMSNVFTINGMENQDPYLNLNNSGATNLMLGQNEVLEASVVTNGYSGQYGGLAGANVNYVTKSGGNDFHGRAIYYWNGRALNANNWFNNRDGTPRPFSNANQWGGEFGGPIKKDKLFFYFNTEGLRVLLPAAPVQLILPSAAFQTATINNLTARGLSASVPFYQNIFKLYNGTPGISRAVPGNGSPTTDPTGCSGFTGPGGLGTTVNCAVNFFSSPPASLTHENLIAVRGDWNWSKNGRIFGRYQQDKGFQATYTDPINTIFNTTSDQPQYQGQLIETHTFGPNITNQVIIAGQWYSAIFNNTDRAGALAAFPTTLIFGDSSFSTLGGIDYNFPQGRIVTQFLLSDDYSQIRGNHTFKVGVKFRRNKIIDRGYGVLTSGELIPIGIDDFFDGGNGQDPVLGAFTELVQRFPSTLSQAFANYTVGGYVEDDWRMNPNFTLTLSLRVDHPSNPTCLDLCVARFASPFLGGLVHDPNIPYNQAIVTGQKQTLPGQTNLEWQPRVGFAWEPFGGRHNMVIRGGIGIFYDGFPSFVGGDLSRNLPNLIRLTVFGDNLAYTQTTNNLLNAQAIANAIRTGFNAGLTRAQIQASLPPALRGFFAPPAFIATDGFIHEPQVQKWNLEIQKGLWRNSSFSIGYLGSHGIHEPIVNSGVNAINTPLPTFTSLPATAPDPRFRTVTVDSTDGISNYHGMALTFKQRFSGGVLQVNYTYSRAMDVLGGLEPFNFNTNTSIRSQEDPSNLHRQYGPADWDVKHYLSANYVWEVPFKSLFRGHGPNTLLRGWQVSGTVFTRSGLPYTVRDGTTTSALASRGYGATVFANTTGGGVVSCKSVDPTLPSLDVCLSRSAFSRATTGFGNLGRNSFRGPKFFDSDFTIMKKTKIPGWERGELGIGFQFYNVFNHPNFDQPVNNVTSPLFGRVNSTVFSPTSILGSFLGGDASPRIIQLKAQFSF